MEIRLGNKHFKRQPGKDTNNVQNCMYFCKTVYPIAGNGVQTNDTIHNVVLI